MNSNIKQILIIVDPQNDFIEGGSLPVPGAKKAMDALTSYIKKYGKTFNLILVTIDRHSKHHCSFIENGGKWPMHCVDGTYGQEIYLPLNNALVHLDFGSVVLLSKGNENNREEYSILRSKNSRLFVIEELLDPKFSKVNVKICGLAGDVCVKTTYEDIKNLFKLYDIQGSIEILEEFSPKINK